MLGYLRINKMLTIDYLENNKTTIDNVSLKDRKNIKILFIDDEGLSGPSELRYEKKLLFGFKCPALLDVSLDYDYEFNIDEITEKIKNSKTKIICHRNLKMKSKPSNLLDW